MCQGLNSHYFHIIGDGHQPNSRGLYTHYKDSYWRWDDHPQYSDFWPWHTCLVGNPYYKPVCDATGILAPVFFSSSILVAWSFITLSPVFPVFLPGGIWNSEEVGDFRLALVTRDMLVVKGVCIFFDAMLLSRERVHNISHQTGSCENHRLKSAFGMWCTPLENEHGSHENHPVEKENHLNHPPPFLGSSRFLFTVGWVL